jgi:predicted glycogen debranching enzyme
MSVQNNNAMNSTAEWLEADGLGGFASGTVNGIRTRRYHALLLTALRPPTDRILLVNGFDAWVDTPNGRFALSSQRYSPDIVHPDGASRLDSFAAEPWPQWRFMLENGIEIEHELVVPHGRALTLLTWRIRMGKKSVRLSVRLFFSGRDYHSLQHENSLFEFTPERARDNFIWHPYPATPGVVAMTEAEYVHDPQWYHNFLYTEERARGLDDTEDLASPGIFQWDLAQGQATLMLGVAEEGKDMPRRRGSIESIAQKLKEQERARRNAFPSRLHRSGDAYIVRRGEGKTIIAGYPWFTDWGRDTFIALRGLCLATGRLHDARDILLEWAGTVSEGMLPNCFPDKAVTPEYNAVDASLWFIIAVHDYFAAMESGKRRVSSTDRKRLYDAAAAILSGYSTGTRFGIRLDQDGLLAAGVPGVQLTWMDAKVGDWVVTPRIGKPVEVQALWLNALWISRRQSKQWEDLFEQGVSSFRTRFWNAAGNYLYDVIDVDHRAGVTDARFRPNQIFAIGGLPLALLEGEQTMRVVEAVEARLWTPLGLRSLAPEEPEYMAHYEGDPRQRDAAYHQGTVWPWLSGAFVEAWVRVHGSTRDAKQQARKRFLESLLLHLDDAGLGHISEIADGDPVYTPRGCPFQAWSVGEALRLSLSVLK